jgi:hypothetical protein
MAWEIVAYYKEHIGDLLEPSSRSLDLRAASIISNGSAAFAIQVLLRYFELPALRVLIDSDTDPKIQELLERVGCEVYVHDLSEQELGSEDVLRLTHNLNGFDFTSRRFIDPRGRTYYDWLAYEVLNDKAKHIFVPVGTGDLFVNILTILRDERSGARVDPRLLGSSAAIEGLNVYGATSYTPGTKMDKLYAKYRPTLREAEQLVEDCRNDGTCGPLSKIEGVQERSIRDALDLASSNNIECDASGIAGLSLLFQKVREGQEYPESEGILVVNTGWLALPAG